MGYFVNNTNEARAQKCSGTTRYLLSTEDSTLKTHA